MSRVQVVAGPEELAEAAARAALADLEAAIDAHETCTWVLTGGGTPQAAYRRLTRHDLRDSIEWGRVRVAMGDERCVPPRDPESNWGQAAEALLDHVPVPEEQRLRMRGELGAEEAAKEYEAALERLPRRAGPAAGRAAGTGEEGGPARPVPRLDVVWIGVGPDGHAARPREPHARRPGRRRSPAGAGQRARQGGRGRPRSRRRPGPADHQGGGRRRASRRNRHLAPRPPRRRHLIPGPVPGPARGRRPAPAVGAIQIDSINVVARSHELVLAARSGVHDPAAFERLVYRRRAGFEYWGHAASFLPIETYRLFLPRMATSACVPSTPSRRWRRRWPPGCSRRSPSPAGRSPPTSSLARPSRVARSTRRCCAARSTR